MAMGPSPDCNSFWSMICTSMGQMKAAVFPLPVLAMPIMSRPLRAMGTPCGRALEVRTSVRSITAWEEAKGIARRSLKYLALDGRRLRVLRFPDLVHQLLVKAKVSKAGAGLRGGSSRHLIAHRSHMITTREKQGFTPKGGGSSGGISISSNCSLQTVEGLPLLSDTYPQVQLLP